MKALQCDRCGKYYKEPYISSTVYLYRKHAYTNDEKMDLCPECGEELEKWLYEEIQRRLTERLQKMTTNKQNLQ